MTSQGPAIATEPISDVSDVSDGASRSVPRRTAAGARIPSVADRLSSAVGHVAMVCAPAGYGKTTQVASWAAGDGRPVAWIDLEPRLNEPEVLLSALASALESVTDVDCTGLANATRSPAQQATIAAPRLGEMIACSVEPFILVLDDIHVIHELAALDLIQAIVWNVPAPSTVVLVGRGELAVPLARMRAHDNLIDITRTDLALDVPAASRALRELGVELGEDEVAGIVAETEGWAVGVRLAGLAIRDAGDRSARDPAGCIDHDRTVSEYVHEEWLRGVPDDDVEFLMRLSGLDWLDGAVCDWVLDRSDSGERLERLHRSRLIVIPLGRRASSYRMHALLRDVLDATFERIDRIGRAEIDRRVSEWFERTGDIDRSVHHALRAGDSARAQDLVCRYAAAHHTQGRYITVNRWLSAFSRDQVLGESSVVSDSGDDVARVG